MAASVGVTDMVSRQSAAVAFQAVEHFEERNVGLGDRLVEPIFLEKVVVLRMADVRQMSVQDQTKIAERHCATSPDVVSV